MTRRPGDTTPEPPGGRAAERLRMFEDARGVKEVVTDQKKKKKRTKEVSSKQKGGLSDEEQDRRRE